MEKQQHRKINKLHNRKINGNYSTHFFNAANLSNFARRWKIFIWWDSLPGHDGRVPRINDSLTTTGEYLTSNLKHDVRLQVSAV